MVYAASGRDVKTTIVNGKILMEDYEVRCLDEQIILEKMEKTSKDLVSRINS